MAIQMWALAVSSWSLGFNVVNLCGTLLVTRTVVYLGCWKGGLQVPAVVVAEMRR